METGAQASATRQDLRVGLATVNSLAWGQLTPLNADVEAKLVVQSDFKIKSIYPLQM